MNAEELAGRLNRREYTNEITPDEERLAKESGLLVVFGASDDLCELRGVIDDELGSYGGSEFYVSGATLLPPVEDEEVEILAKHGALDYVNQKAARAIKISSKWCAKKDCSWTFETSAPHAKFDIMEDGEKYCEGIVVSTITIAAHDVCDSSSK